ncbi:MAG: hypothetical protein C0179_05475 [Fervidicoccus sp.]|nr:MAG: hypothetical protein C0179_05475 [Fervidicoccus sp.]
METNTVKLIRALEGSAKLEEDELKGLLKLAGENKVLLGLLRKTNSRDEIKRDEERRYRRFAGSVIEVAEALKDLNYALHKFRKPVEHVSVDIDVLIDRRDLTEAARRLSDRGFRVEVSEKYTVTMTRGSTIVDLYTNPAFAWVIYLDGSKLLECCTEDFEFEGYTLKGLSREAEVVVSASHAVYKEHIYLLIDYFTVKKWLNERALKLSAELGAEESIKIASMLNDLVESGSMELPSRIPPALLARAYSLKFLKDEEFRATSPNLLKYLISERAGKAIFWRLTRKTY